MVWDSIDKRRFLRIEFPYTVHIRDGKRGNFSTYTEDISIGGVRVVIKEKLKISAIVDLEIYLTRFPMICRGKITWIKEKQNDFLEDIPFFDIGIEFCDLREKHTLLVSKCVRDLEEKKNEGSL